MSPLVKHLRKIRNKSIRKEDNEQLQNRINTLIRANMVTSVKNKNGENASRSKKWWDKRLSFKSHGERFFSERASNR